MKMFSNYLAALMPMICLTVFSMAYFGVKYGLIVVSLGWAWILIGLPLEYYNHRQLMED